MASKNRPVNEGDERFTIGSSSVTLGGNTNIRNMNSSRWGREGGGGRILKYPDDLGVDSTHYIIFHIYETEPQGIIDETAGAARVTEYELQLEQYNKLEEGVDGILTDDQKNQAKKVDDAADRVRQFGTQQRNIKKQQEAEVTSGGSRVSQPQHISKDSIVLYMPQKINSMNMVDYELGDFALAQGIKGALKDGYGSGFWSKMEGLLGPASNIILNKMVGEFAGAVGIGNPFDVVKLIGRVAINPQKEMVFNAPAPRKYEFAFEFASRSEEEAVMVRNIVQLFKFHAFPRTENLFSGDEEVDVSGQLPTKGMTWYRTPSEFQFEYLHIDKRDGHEIVTENHFLNRAERCVLTEVNVDYSGAGAFQSFEDGAPTHITLTLTFSEARLITQEHIALGY